MCSLCVIFSILAKPVLIRNSVFYLFVLLQCLAPLLHAHAGGPLAGGPLHGGLHLPDCAGVPAFCGDLMQIPATPDSPVVTPTSSLQARDAVPLAMPSGPTLRVPAIHDGQTVWMSAVAPRPMALASRHLIPLPGAPPRI